MLQWALRGKRAILLLEHRDLLEADACNQGGGTLKSGDALLEHRDLHEADACNREQYLKREVHGDAVGGTSETLPSGRTLRGLQRSFEVIRGHPRSSEVIRGHSRSSEVIRGLPRSFEGFEGFQGTLTAFWERKEGWSLPCVRLRVTKEIK